MQDSVAQVNLTFVGCITSSSSPVVYHIFDATFLCIYAAIILECLNSSAALQHTIEKSFLMVLEAIISWGSRMS